MIFKKGDDVILKRKAREYNGEVGKIVELTPFYELVTVEFPRNRNSKFVGISLVMRTFMENLKKVDKEIYESPLAKAMSEDE